MLRKIGTALVATAIVAGTVLAAASPADAKGDWYWKKHPHNYNYSYNHYDNGGGYIAAGILGLLGGLALSEVAHPHYGYGGVGYCEWHFKTYNSTTHLYMGYDGKPHSCFD